MRENLLHAALFVAAGVGCANRAEPVRPVPPPLPPAVAAPSAPAPSGASCVLDGRPGAWTRLTVTRDGRTVLSRAEEIAWVELAGGAPGGSLRAVASTRELDIAGEIPDGALVVSPRAPALRDGWLAVRSLHARRVGPDGAVTGVVTLRSPLVAAGPIEVTAACDTLQVGNAPEPTAGELRFLRPGAQSPFVDGAGRAVANLVVPASGPRATARVLEARGDATRVAIRGEDATAIGWIATSAVEPVTPATRTALLAAQAEELQLQMLAGFGQDSSATKCARRVDLYASQPGGQPVVIGSLREGATIRRRAGAAPPDGVAVELGGEGAVFVRASSLASCNAMGSEPVTVAVRGRGLVTRPAGAPSGEVLGALGGGSPAPGPGLGDRPPDAGAPVDAERRVTGPAGTLTATVEDDRFVPSAPREIARVRAQLRGCYQHGLNADPTVAGETRFGVQVSASGEVASVRSIDSQGLPSATRSCFEHVLRRARFAAGSPGAFTVRVVGSVARK